MSKKAVGNAELLKFPDAAKKETNETSKKWGLPVLDLGFTIVPSLLLKAQARLDLTAQELVVLLQIIDHWWDADNWPYPGKAILAERLNLSTKQIQRHTASLEKKGILTKKQRYGAKHKGKLSNEYNLSGLVSKLKELEPEFTEAKNAQRALSKRRGINFTS